MPEQMPITESMKTATAAAIAKMARMTAKQATGKRKRDAERHCKQLGLTPLCEVSSCNDDAKYHIFGRNLCGIHGAEAYEASK